MMHETVAVRAAGIWEWAVRECIRRSSDGPLVLPFVRRLTCREPRERERTDLGGRGKVGAIKADD